MNELNIQASFQTIKVWKNKAQKIPYKFFLRKSPNDRWNFNISHDIRYDA